MHVKQIRHFNINEKEEFIKTQQSLKHKINLSPTIAPDSINTCAGVDLAYWDQDGEPYGVCSIIVIDADTKEVIEKVHSIVSGFLAFRELPLIIEAAKKLETEPDVFLFDGNGYLHYNHMGVATHAAFFLGKPTIGIAKTYLKIKGCDFVMPENEVGAYTDIIIDGVVYGRALRTRRDVKPIFLSCGNDINLESSYQITMSLINQESRLPIPVRLADLETHVLRTFYQKNHV
ncbi:endonuclease V [Bacillus amyloliquefaciens]|uniref:endonuclease V n=1 Tax=Bacillus amyloliquefaciens TaxID=1390 RepID=UPI002452FE3E|nr:endonuclease V [Bacillus amyloliquefaciens]MDH3088179.1 endonuclease V [Bacillus amyloliquefaciens]